MTTAGSRGLSSSLSHIETNYPRCGICLKNNANSFIFLVDKPKRLGYYKNVRREENEVHQQPEIFGRRDRGSKKVELIDATSVPVLIPCAYVGIIDGEEYAAVVDRHHTLAAARELGLAVDFVVGDDSEGLTGDDYLNARYIDSAWYDIETGIEIW